MRIYFLFILFHFSQFTFTQITGTAKWWLDKGRLPGYHPVGEYFVITNGKRPITRAFYGIHTIYLAGMGGKNGITTGCYRIII